MNRKIIFMIPAFAAVFAIMFVFVTPYVVAEMGDKKHGDMIEMINAYCAMSPEEQAEVIAKHNKSEDKVAKMNEYCSLDEKGRAALIAEHKEKFEKHTDVTKHGMTGMSGEYDSSKHAGFVEKIQELKQAYANGDFDKVKELTVELQDLRNQIVEEIRH